jgi:integrase
LEVVRSVVPDPNVQPNHAWRYTFKTYGYEAGVDHLTLDAICGHSAKSKGDDYTKVTLKKRMEAMAVFPRYSVQ